MSRRRRKTTAAITLFSFQDIIMSTSGIMIMIVLLLSLELIQRRGHAGVAWNLVELEAEISTANHTIERIEAELKSGDKLVQTASTISPIELKARLQNLLTANTALTHERDQLSDAIRVLGQSTPETLAQERQKELQDARVGELQQQRAALELQLQQTQQDDRPIFSFPRGTETSGWLVEIAAKRIQAAPFGRAERPLVFSGKPGTLINKTPQEEFLNWSALQSGQQAYFFLLVRPDGASAFEEISMQFDRRRTRYGFDVFGTGPVLLHPERGAVE